MVAACSIVTSCVTTTASVPPSSQTPVCDRTASALIIWATQWRPDQKDVPEREATAETGLKEVLQNSGCFARSDLRRLPSMTPAAVAVEVAQANGQFDKVIAITLRELGPVIKLLSSPALIDSGTEVILQVAEHMSPARSRLEYSPSTGRTAVLASSKTWPRYHKICKQHS